MNENRMKTITGLMGRGDLLSALIELRNERVIKSCSSNYRCGHPNYKEEQYFAPFYIEFNNGIAWILYTTNSIRSDRMTYQQWNTEHIKEICRQVEKSFVIVPDRIEENEKELAMAQRYNQRILEKTFYSPVDGVLSQTNLVKEVLNYADSIC